LPPRAKLFVAEGASVVFGDVLDDDGKKLEAEIRAAGRPATYVHLDVTARGGLAGRRWRPRDRRTAS
jgi:NAD(P)-dependent dehydrogenase (short-subunit alcohol dehydrogenase family)